MAKKQKKVNGTTVVKSFSLQPETADYIKRKSEAQDKFQSRVIEDMVARDRKEVEQLAKAKPAAR